MCYRKEKGQMIKPTFKISFLIQLLNTLDKHDNTSIVLSQVWKLYNIQRKPMKPKQIDCRIYNTGNNSF